MATIRDRFVFLIALAIHFAASAFAFVMSFGLSMGRFDTGAEPSQGERLLAGMSEVLSFPVVPLFLGLDSVHLPGLFGWLPWLANSALWAGVCILLRRAANGLVARRNRYAGA